MGWIETRFESFGITHAVIVTIGLAVCFACGIIARRQAFQDRRTFADGFAGIVLGWNLLANTWWLLPENWDIAKSLPLHVCDLTNLLIPIAIWSRSRVFLTVSVFWGLGLGTQAFVTPTVDASPSDMEYWLFWIGHLTIASACCVIAGGTGYRPRWSDWRRVTLVSFVVLLLLIGVNETLGSNYGYVGNRKPEAKTLIDFLGQWPLRTAWLFIIASIAHALVLLCYPILPKLFGVPTDRAMP